MFDVKVATDCYIPRDNIKYYVGYARASIKTEVRKKRHEGKVIDFTNGKSILSVIYLKSGELVLVNTAVDTINSRINASVK